MSDYRELVERIKRFPQGLSSLYPGEVAAFCDEVATAIERLTQELAAERERCAVIAWSTGMDEHKKRQALPHDCREIGSLIAAAIRKG